MQNFHPSAQVCLATKAMCEAAVEQVTDHAGRLRSAYSHAQRHTIVRIVIMRRLRVKSIGTQSWHPLAYRWNRVVLLRASQPTPS